MPSKRPGTSPAAPSTPSADRAPSVSERSKAKGARRGKAGEAHDDGPLESLGKAVSTPVIGTAEPDEGEKPDEER